MNMNCEAIPKDYQVSLVMAARSEDSMHIRRLVVEYCVRTGWPERSGRAVRGRKEHH